MEQQGKPQSVSHAHVPKAPIPKPNESAGNARSVMAKKSQLQEALGEFKAQEDKTAHSSRSLLSDEGAVLHVGREEQGTIITDTKHKRWSVTDAVKGALGGWYGKKHAQVEKALHKDEPKKTIAAPSTRTETIQKAAAKSSLPDAEHFKSVKPRTPIPGRSRAQSSVRIKERNIPKEIGDTAPHWTHIVAAKKQAAREQTESKPTTSNSDTKSETKLVESPRHGRRLLTSPEERKPARVQKTYRRATNAPAIKVAGVTIAARPKKESETPPPTPKASRQAQPANTTPTPKQTPTPQQKEPGVSAPTLTPASAHTPVGSDTPTIPIVTIVLVIIFIVVLAISTTLLGTL